MDEKILSDAQLAALEPPKYVQLQKLDKKGITTTKVKVNVNRILAVHGGLADVEGEHRFDLELSARSGKSSTVHYKGSSEELFAQFNKLGVRKDFLAYEEVYDRLSYMKRAKVEQSAVRIALINAIQRPAGHRTVNGYKVKSVIQRLDGKPLDAFEEVAELGKRIVAQGFVAAPGSSALAFMLHPDQPELLNQQGQRLTPPKPPRRKLRDKGRTLI